MNSTEKSILIVDDQPGNLQLLMTLLKQKKYKVYVADGGNRALTVLENTEPDLILLDVMMPVMNGYETCEAIKANPQTAQIPIIFMTALDRNEDKKAAFTAGAADFVTKPLQQAELFARVNVHIALRQSEKALAAARQEIEELQSLLPECLFCQVKRKDETYQQNVDRYLKRKDAEEQSTAICPDCAKGR